MLPSGQNPSRDQYDLSFRMASALPTLGGASLFNASGSLATEGVNCNGQAYRPLASIPMLFLRSQQHMTRRLLTGMFRSKRMQI